MDFGTLLGNGCTSGHGVCGISRFSVRSIVATFTFIIFGIISVLILNFCKRSVSRKILLHLLLVLSLRWGQDKWYDTNPSGAWLFRCVWRLELFPIGAGRSHFYSFYPYFIKKKALHYLIV